MWYETSVSLAESPLSSGSWAAAASARRDRTVFRPSADMVVILRAQILLGVCHFLTKRRQVEFIGYKPSKNIYFCQVYFIDWELQDGGG